MAGPPATNGSGSDPLTELQAVVEAIGHAASAGNALGDRDIRRLRDACKRAMTDLAQGHYPAGFKHATIPQRIAYQLEVRDAYTTAVGLLLDAASARDPYAPELEIA